MAATISETLKQTMRELALELPFKKISTSLICERAHVSRAAFYARFANKEALLGAVIAEDICESVLTIRNTITTSKFHASTHSLVDEVQCSNILAHAEFYRRIVDECPELFVDELTKGLVRVNDAVLQDYPLSDDEKEYMSFFYASSHAMLYLKWIRDGMHIDSSTLCNWYFKWATDSWQRISAELGVKELEAI